MTDARLTVKRFRVNRNNLLDKVDQKGYADFLRLDVLAVKASDYDALLQRVEELEQQGADAVRLRLNTSGVLTCDVSGSAQFIAEVMAQGSRDKMKRLEAENAALKSALRKLLEESLAIHGDDLADERTIEQARIALQEARAKEVEG